MSCLIFLGFEVLSSPIGWNKKNLSRKSKEAVDCWIACVPFILIEKKVSDTNIFCQKLVSSFVTLDMFFFCFFFKMAFEFNTIEGNFESMHVLLA